MERSVLIAGFGGQGVMLIGKMLGYAAIKMGLQATFFPAYGAEQRGGTANCTLITSESEIECPLLEKFDDLVIMNQLSLATFAGAVKMGGKILINSSLVKADEKAYPNCIKVPCGDIAIEAGSIKAANMVALGSYIALHDTFDLEIVKTLVEQSFESKPALAEMNLRAIDAGYRTIRSMQQV